MKHRIHLVGSGRTRLGMPAALAALILLAACATTGPGTAGGPERRAERLAEAGEHAAAAGEYIGLAGTVTGGDRERLTLLAIEQWLEAGDGRRARNALQRIPAPDGGPLLGLWSNNAAALALWEGRPDDALALLEPLLREPLPRALRLRAESLQADAWFQKGDPIRAVELYRQRGESLTSAAAQRDNLERLWAGLLVTRPRELRAAAELATGRVQKGWLELGALATTTGRQGIGWGNGVKRWLETYPTHPAGALLGDMELPSGDELGYPRRIALLLPLSGDNAPAGEAVQHGFFGAYFAAATELEVPQQVRVYDAHGAAARAYEQAVADGAEFVVGPLLREGVIDVAAASPLPVPVLALNYLPDGMHPPAALYQFALSPEDEAVAAAQRALADGRRHALVLVPRSDWGRRLASSFASAFESGGGTVLEAREYEPGKQDFSFEIEALMLLSQSVQRYQRLRANLGRPLQYDPRRRQDAEFVFLAATAPAGRLLKSQLKFHYAGDLPVYSTSRIFSMDGRSNSDLNGVLFADTPWVVDPQPWLASLDNLIRDAWPDQRRLGRLHALGYDAYQLTAALHGSRLQPMPDLDGATGTLWLDTDGRVHRRLAWARFENGEPVPVPPADTRPAETGEDGDVVWIERSTSGR